jgi:hypothetical protein
MCNVNHEQRPISIDRATSNETLASGPDSAAALRRYFPSLTGEDVQEIEKLYSQQVFVSAESRQLEVTGDHSARCGVGLPQVRAITRRY